ncbi:TPA: S1 family peptidase [Enterococcus faecalis]
MRNPKDVAEQLISTTVKLAVNDGKAVGTGFFFKAAERENGDFKPVIVTNRHVFEDAENVEIMLTLINSDEVHEVKKFKIGQLKGAVVFHPDIDVDLAVLPCPGIFNILQLQGYKIDTIFLEKKLVPNEVQMKDISAIEDVYIIGYPNGYMDEVNNRPLVRKGITASDFKLDYNGEKKFLVDSAIFGGSSGSPVFIYNRGGFFDGEGNFSFGQSRVLFLGINSAVMIQNLDGKIVERDMPTSIETVTRMPIGLGIIIKAELLSDFDDIMPE